MAKSKHDHDHEHGGCNHTHPLFGLGVAGVIVAICGAAFWALHG